MRKREKRGRRGGEEVGGNSGRRALASCVRLFDVHKNQTVDLIELEDNEGAVSICACVFHERGDEV